MEGTANLYVQANRDGKFSYRAEGDRLGKFALLSVLQLVTRDLTDEVYAGISRLKDPMPNADKTAQGSPEMDAPRPEDYTDGVSMPKHEAIQSYLGLMQKLRSRILAMKDTSEDETFVVPTSLINRL